MSGVGDRWNRRDDLKTGPADAPVGLRGGLVVLLAGAVGLAGCQSFEDQVPSSVRVSSQPMAGTVLTAPTSAAPWEDVSASLKPGFALTGDQAAAQVLPTTESISQYVLTSLGASLAVGLPTSSNTYASTTTTGGASPGTTSTATDTRNPGTPLAIANTLASGASLPTPTPYSGTLGLDPVLKYKAANYLFQEVQLLNQQIDNAANRSC